MSLNADLDVDSEVRLALVRQRNAAKVQRLLKRLAETQKSLVLHTEKRAKYADSGNDFLNEGNSC